MMQDKSQLQAFYRLSELAEVARTTRYLMELLLRQAGVRSVRAGRSIVIPVSEIKEKIPLLWESLHTVHQARRAAEEAPRTGRTARRRGYPGERL